MIVKVLLTCVGGGLVPQMITLFRKSKRYHLDIVGTDISKNAVGKKFCDQFFVVPKGSSGGYVKKIEFIVKKEKIDLIIPTSDEEAVALAAKRKVFEKIGAKLACTDIATLRILRDKSKTFQYMEKAGIKMPKWYCAKNLGEIKKYGKKMVEEYGEVVIKPAIERGGRGVTIISEQTKRKKKNTDRVSFYTSYNEFSKKLPSSKFSFPSIVMEKLQDPVFDVDMLGWKGDPVSIVARRRLNPIYPNLGHLIVQNKELTKLAKKIISIFNLSWLYDCDVMYSKNKVPHVIEINPRQSGSVAVSLAAGLPLLENVVALSLGQKIKNRNITAEKKIKLSTSLKALNR